MMISRRSLAIISVIVLMVIWGSTFVITKAAAQEIAPAMLADNAQGNLTEEQVKFASDIYSAGNDLLELINDILDLSKIEARQID